MSVTVVLISITVAISFYASGKPELLRRLMMNPYQIKTRNQYYRFISSGFIHKDLCMPGFVFGAGYMAYSYYQGRNAKDNINHDAHLYGALYGLLFCVVVYPASLLQFYEQVRYWVSTFF